MSKQRESHRHALQQLLDRHSIGNLRQERGQVIDREHLVAEILRLNDRFNYNASLDEV